MKTPVALIIFNRPDCTARVFKAVAKAKPEKLLVIADGPRSNKPDDAEKCAATRAVIEQVDWDCQVLTEYSHINLGCRKRVSSGIDWVFKQVEEAIIIEDDCLPHSSFFPYCEELLYRYRQDERIMMISGLNFLGEWKTSSQSYYFSYFGGIWGWASWRRAWDKYDCDLKIWPQVLETKVLEQMFPDLRHYEYWKNIFQQVYEAKIDTWDYQWLLACWINSGYRIFPEVNLITNIGFGSDATHTFGDSPLANMPAQEISFPLKHPQFVMRSVEADNRIQEMFCDLSSSGTPAKGVAARIAGRLGLLR